MDFNWYTTVAGVVAATMVLVGIIKRALGNVPYANTVPTWLYAVASSAILTYVANRIWATLPGDLMQNLMQAVMLAGTASGFYDWLNRPTSSLAETAIKAGVDVSPKNAPDRIDVRELQAETVKTPKILTYILLAGILGGTASCATASPTLSPKGEAAFHAIRVVKALDLIRDTAVDAHDQSPPLISTADTRAIVNWHSAILRTIRAVPDGWKPIVLAALEQLRADVRPESWQRLVLYINLLKTILAEVP